MVLEKTLESPLDSKEIKPINPKWIFTGKTDAKVDAPILWPPDANSSLEKTLRMGKIEGRGQVGDTGWDGWMALLEETLVDSEGQGSLVCCSSWGCRVGHNSSTKQQYQSTEFINALKCFLKAVTFQPGDCKHHCCKGSFRPGRSWRQEQPAGEADPTWRPSPEVCSSKAVGTFFISSAFFQIL